MDYRKLQNRTCLSELDSSYFKSGVKINFSFCRKVFNSSELLGLALILIHRGFCSFDLSNMPQENETIYMFSSVPLVSCYSWIENVRSVLLCGTKCLCFLLYVIYSEILWLQPILRKSLLQRTSFTAMISIRCTYRLFYRVELLRVNVFSPKKEILSKRHKKACLSNF